MVNEAELKAEMVRNRMTTEAVAEALGISRQSLSLKMNNHRPFTHHEMVKIIELLGLSDEVRDRIFFDNKVAEMDT